MESARLREFEVLYRNLHNLQHKEVVDKHYHLASIMPLVIGLGR